MKKLLSILSLALTPFLCAQPCVPKQGQACMQGNKLPATVEVTDQEGRRMVLDFSRNNQLECQVNLSNFRPNETYNCQVVTFGETRNTQGRISSDGTARFPVNLTAESKIRCSCTEPSSRIEVQAGNQPNPLSIHIDWSRK